MQQASWITFARAKIPLGVRLSYILRPRRRSLYTAELIDRRANFGNLIGVHDGVCVYSGDARY